MMSKVGPWLGKPAWEREMEAQDILKEMHASRVWQFAPRQTFTPCEDRNCGVCWGIAKSLNLAWPPKGD